MDNFHKFKFKIKIFRKISFKTLNQKTAKNEGKKCRKFT
jgi:hypothetical protein